MVDKAAGLDAPWLHSCTVVTTQANDTMAKIHDRMLVILPASAWPTWLDAGNDDIETLQKLLVPAPNELDDASDLDGREQGVEQRRSTSST